ncbi:MAG: hypothetical protein IID51_06495 [Proteobacteria bacterium]|nr:hypothetical protein [Pseudomonadota bacterium]
MKTVKTLVAALVLMGAGGALADEYVDSEDQTLRFREAVFYAQTASSNGVDVGIDRLSEDEQVRIFGKVISGYVPYNVAVTNNSGVRVYIDDIQLLDRATQSSTAPDDLNAVLLKVSSFRGGNRDHLRMSILRTNLISKSLQSVIVAPGDTVQGIVFAEEAQLGEGGGNLQLRLQSLERVAFVEIEVPFSR